MEGPGFVIGNIAKGSDLWDRHEEIKNITNALKTSSVLLKAPRRFGKTSIMYKIYETSGNMKVIFQNTEGMRDPQDFIARLMTEIFLDRNFWDKVVSWVKRKIPSVEEMGFSLARAEDINIADFRLKIRESIGKYWQEKGAELISKIKQYQGEVLFILDELPLLVQNIMRKEGEETAYDFMHWFRSIRQMPELSHVKWLVGGSIGIEHILSQIAAGSQVINDFQIIRVEPFSEIDAQEYIRAVLKKEGQINRIDMSVVDEIMKIIGAPVPYFIQILLYESLNEMRRRKRRTLNKDIIHMAYKSGVLGPASRTYFEHYFTRLKDYYNKEREDIAKRLILEVARTGTVKKNDLYRLFRQESKGKLDDEVFSYLLTDIENDFYVSYDDQNQCYSFATNILKDWWLRYYDLVEEE
jgi:hypothetical protein